VQGQSAASVCAKSADDMAPVPITRKQRWFLVSGRLDQILAVFVVEFSGVHQTRATTKSQIEGFSKDVPAKVRYVTKYISF